MHDRELWLTRLFNDYLAGPANQILNAVHMPAENPAHPWTNWLVMELLVVAIIIVLLPIVRSRLSVDNPGKLQHLFELTYQFILDQIHEVGIHHGAEGYVPYFGTLFVFILFMNLIGIIPTFESPTMNPAVPLGLALCTFLYYHAKGIKAHGIGKYLLHFAGPIPALFLLMVPIELMGHFARPLSLTIRLYANMFAGEQVTMAFLGLTKFIIPAIFMALHVFVSLLQAYIFTLLSMIYVSIATEHEEEPA
jgi:F-type H+-transporting ATPase subunit a